MSIDTANNIINEQEDAIAELKHKVLDMEDQRDLAQDKLIQLQKAMRRIECADHIDLCHQIARECAKIGV